MAKRRRQKKLNDRLYMQGKNFVRAISYELQLQFLACFGFLIVMLICFLPLFDYMIKRKEGYELNMNGRIKCSLYSRSELSLYDKWI